MISFLCYYFYFNTGLPASKGEKCEFSLFEKIFGKSLDKPGASVYNKYCSCEGNLLQRTDGGIAQLGEHLPYKQEVTGSSPVVPTRNGLLAQLVRALACHARGRGFEPHAGRHFFLPFPAYASVAQSVEQGTENPRVVGSIPTGSTTLRI